MIGPLGNNMKANDTVRVCTAMSFSQHDTRLGLELDHDAQGMWIALHPDMNSSKFHASVGLVCFS